MDNVSSQAMPITDDRAESYSSYSQSGPNRGGTARVTHDDAATTETPVANSLQQEYETWLANKEQLLADHEGEWVMIRGNQIVKIFPNEDAAEQYGYDTYGYSDLCVIHIVKDTHPTSFGPLFRAA